MGAVGGVIRATSGPPKYSTISSVKNTALQGSIDSAIGGIGALQNQNNAALDKFSSEWDAGTPAAGARTNQEIGALDQFYNGSMANQLSGLRSQRKTAMTDAANVASQQAIASQNRSRLTGSGGAGSYNTRLSMANLTPIRTQAALDDANQARADLGYLTQNQVGLAGQRNTMANTQAQRGLVPSQTRLQSLGAMNQYMSGLTNLDQANKFYGLQKEPNMWADVADSLDQGILNAAGVYSSMGGGMGGMKEGGMVHGPGTGTSDSIPVRLSKGEYVVPADVVHIPGILPLLEKIRHLHRMHGVGKHQEALKMHLARQKKASKEGRGLARGGAVRGYEDGGEIGNGVPVSEDAPVASTAWDGGVWPSGGGDYSGGGDESGGGGGGGKKKGGGGGGGAFAAAAGLQARVDADLQAEWKRPSMINAASQGVGPGAGAPRGLSPRATSMPMSSPTSDGMANRGGQNLQGTPYFHPDNWASLPDEYKVIGAQTAAKYNDPKSPHYIPPGTYE